jgi:hypothetical protein
VQINFQRLRSYSEDLEALGLDVKVAQTYAEEQVHVPGHDTGYILDIAGHVATMQSQVLQYLLATQDALRMSAAELSALRRMFEDTDEAAREAFDAQVLPDSYPVPALDLPAVSTPMDDTLPTGQTDIPSGALFAPTSTVLGTPVANDRAYSDWMSVVDVVDLLSPSTYIAKGLELTIGFNPIEELASWMAGDWTEVAQAGSAMVQLAEYAHICALNLWVASEHGLFTWSGNTAAAASNYFSSLQVAIYAGDPACRALGSGLQEAATGMYHLANSLSGLIATFLDELIDIGIHALAAAGSSWSIFGGLFFGGWALWDTKQAIDLWDDIMDIKDAVRGLVDTIAALVLTSSPTASPLPAIPAGYVAPEG